MGLDDELSERGRSLSEPTQTETVKLEERITQLWHTLLIRNADYAQEASIWHVRTEPIQDYLAPETMLVEYFVARGRMLACLVTRQSIRVVQLPGQLNDVRAQLPRAWLNLKTVPRSPADRIPHLADKLKTVLCSLQEILIAPIEHQLADHAQLIIVPHGPLHYVPFHALHDGSGYLLERHLISYLPVASLLRYCQGVQSPTKDLVAIGHSKGGLLPYTVQEARSIAAIMGGSSLLEEQATLDRVRERAAACRSIHIATHGEFRSDNPLFSGLDLEDGSLTTLETFNWRLQASLVTLSACQTGWSVVGGGDELLGLMRAFLYAGAATLVLSLWAVHDRSTATLMELFYRNLVDGRSKGEALRGAQLSLLRGELGNGSDGAQRLAHPYFWAPFYLVGDTGPL